MAARSAALTESSSFLLDGIRLAAALMVVIAHLSRPEFSVVQSRNLQFLGDLAVPVFFVLSGFVIRFVTVSREHTLRAYFIDRASRIYSVALPALALSIVTAGLIFAVNPAYAHQFLTPYMTHPVIRVLANLTFVSQVWGFNTVQFADSPFWSLSYECLFYVGYGLFFYLRGAQRGLAVLLWAAVSGPQILFLFPVWLLGCGLYDLYQGVRHQRVSGVVRKLAVLMLIAAVGLAAAGRPGLLLAPVHLDQAIAALPNPLALVHQISIRATMLAVANGLLAAVAMFLLLLLSDGVVLRKDHAFARRFRRLADGTFSIYLMHYPLMMLARSLNLLRPSAPVLDAVTMSAIVLLLIAAAAPLDALKAMMRRLFRSVSAGRYRSLRPVATVQSSSLR